MCLKKVRLSLTRIFGCCKCSIKFMAKMIAFFDEGEGRLPIITCPASFMLVIMRLSVLMKNIMWRAEAFILMSSVKCSAIYTWKYLLESFINNVADFQPATLPKKETAVLMLPCKTHVEVHLHMSDSGRALSFFKNGANSYCC